MGKRARQELKLVFSICFSAFYLSIGLLNVYGQNDDVIAVNYLSTKANIKNTEKLVAKNTKALYFTDSLLIDNQNNANITDVDESTNTITVSQKKIRLDASTFLLAKDLSIVYFTQLSYGKKILVEDSLPEYKWNLDYQEEKKIGQYLCKKATTNFRGSQIVAWYTEEVPVPFGPWKFKGLPGLILEVWNIDGITTNHWIATKINLNVEKEFKYETPQDLKLVKYQTIVENTESELQAMLNRKRASAPK